MTSENPYARNALEGRLILGPTTRRQAVALLNMYAHRDNLTTADVSAILVQLGLTRNTRKAGRTAC